MLERALRVPPKRYFDLVSIMAERYVKIRYRGSSFGVLWSLLNPLAMTSIYALVFGHAFGHYYGSSIFDYLFAVFIGFVAINYFLTSTAQALHSIVANGPLMNKMRVPASVFPVATVAANSVQFLVAIVPLLIVLTLVLARNPLMLLLLPIPLVALFLLTVGVSMVTSTAYVYYRDVPHIYELVSFVIFVGTPVFYPLGIVAPAVRPFIEWTPISLAVEQLRSIVILNHVPAPASFLALALWTIVVFLAGCAIFNRAGRTFLERL